MNDRSDTDDPLPLSLATPRGFCAGVRRAIRIVELALAQTDGPVFVRHAIVHNREVVRDLENRGARFVETLDDVPEGAVVVFSAHGVAKGVVSEAARRGLDTIDATCPLVRKVHAEVARQVASGKHVFLIGHEGHAEVAGTMGQVPDGTITLVDGPLSASQVVLPFGKEAAFAMQTTLSVDDAAATLSILKGRFATIAGPRSDDICYATTNRQEAVKRLAHTCGAVLVVGSDSSSNSRRLKETAEKAGAWSQLVEDETAIDWQFLSLRKPIGITAGASTPDVAVDRVVAAVARRLGGPPILVLEGPAEPDIFALPTRFQHQE